MTCLLTGNIVYAAEAAYDIELTDTHKWNNYFWKNNTSLLGAFYWYDVSGWHNEKYNNPEYKNVHVTFNDRLGDDGKKYGLSISSGNSNKFYMV